MFLPGYDPPGAAADDYARRVRGPGLAEAAAPRSEASRRIRAADGAGSFAIMERFGGGQVGAAATWPGPERGSMKATLARSRPLRARIHTPGGRGGRRSARRSGFDQARRARKAAALARPLVDLTRRD